MSSKFFFPSAFHDLYQPSPCEKRVWLKANRPELAADDTDFKNLLSSRGQLLEQVHLDTLGDYYVPDYREGDFRGGFKATLELMSKGVPVIYQGVFLNEQNKLAGIPDFLILDEQSKRYVIRESKLAVDLNNHPEILLQIGIYRMLLRNTLGYDPRIEVLCGDGTIEGGLDIPSEGQVLETIDYFQGLKLGLEPDEPVGYSKCQQCVFKGYCWNKALESRDIATVAGLDQKAARKLWGMGIRNYDHLYEFSEELLAQVERPWGRRTQRIGPPLAAKIKRQVNSLITERHQVLSAPELPPGYLSGSRPVMMFDIENDVFDPVFGVKVYLWGCLLATGIDQLETRLVLSPPGTDGDRNGWSEFLDYAGTVFESYGDIPFVHYSSHERTWVKRYIERYGDPDGIGQRILNNLWDIYAAITRSLVLPIPSYGLKCVERIAGFKRSQEEFGGLWSIIMYDRYLNAGSPQEARDIISEIMKYNEEDILASYKIYTWYEDIAASAIGS